MKQTVNLNNFIDAFQAMGREESFSYDGKEALFRYLEDCEEGTGKEIELDVVALCCEFTEYLNVEEYADVYGLPYDECPHCGEDLPESGYECSKCGQHTLNQEVVFDYIGDRTVIIKIVDDGFIIVDY